MSDLDRCQPNRRDAVEVLLGGIVGRALLGGATLVGACAPADNPRVERADPVKVDEAGVLYPQPIPFDASVQGDARAAQDVVVVPVREDGGDALGTYDPCVQGPGFPVRAAGLSLAVPADYVAVRSASGDGQADAGVESWTQSKFTLISETGIPCATATSDACESKVAHHPDTIVPSLCVQLCSEWSVVTTRGDEVKRWATPDALMTLLGSIDSDDDALMLAASRGYDVSCPVPGSSLWPAGTEMRYVRQTPAGRELIATRITDQCPVVVRRSRLLVTPAGELRELDYVDFSSDVCIGRVPAGLKSKTRRGVDAFGDYLAQCAHLEAASVHAFVRLAEELAAHGAPTSLVARALQAADDEVRHARTVAALARQHGGVVSEARVAALPVRALPEIARENAVEGCVRETYGALVGAYQAARAQDPELRTAMRSIAADEARHAALSHDVHAWLITQLSSSERAQLVAAQHDAIAELTRECALESSVSKRAGTPSPQVARQMIDELVASLWREQRAA